MTGIWRGRRLKKGLAEPSVPSLPSELLCGSSLPELLQLGMGVVSAGSEGLLGEAPVGKMCIATGGCVIKNIMHCQANAGVAKAGSEGLLEEAPVSNGMHCQLAVSIDRAASKGLLGEAPVVDFMHHWI